VEIILGQARRRWREDEKRALVAETFADGQTVNGVARRHDISRSMLFGWRKQYCGTLGFAPPPSTPIGLSLLRSPDLNRARHQLQPCHLQPRRSSSWSLGAAFGCVFSVLPIPAW
jgi:transposase-like protein